MDELSILGNDVHSLTRDYDLARTGGGEGGRLGSGVANPREFPLCIFFLPARLQNGTRK